MMTRTRPRFLFAPDKGDGSGATNDAGEDDPPGDPDAGDSGGETIGGSSSADTPTLTQAQVDAMFDREFGKRKAKWEKDLAAYAEREGQTEAERAKAERDEAQAALEESRREVLAERVATRAERAALDAGVKPERVDRFMRLVDLGELDDLTADGKPNADAIAALVESTLTDVPEFKGAGGSGKPASGGGDFGGSGGTPKQWTRAELAKLTPAEFDKHEAEIMEQMRAGSIR